MKKNLFVSPLGCKRDTMNQHDKFRKGLQVLFPQFFFHMNGFWNNVLGNFL
jgi:hypothetical protein